MTTVRILAACALLCLASACRNAATSAPGAVRAVAAPEPTAIAVTEKGFEPARVEAAAGVPIVLRFTRTVEQTCADAVDVQGDPVRHMLPLGRAIDVKVTPPASGEIAFACPMQMIRGAVVVLPR